jgi:hypothetical protein
LGAGIELAASAIAAQVQAQTNVLSIAIGTDGDSGMSGMVAFDSSDDGLSDYCAPVASEVRRMGDPPTRQGFAWASIARWLVRLVPAAT